MNRRKLKKSNCTNDFYLVVQFIEKGCKIFECIWDGWFVDENRKSCFWPPNDKSYLIRVLSKEKPDDSWKIYQCIVVSEGHVTYNSGFEIVKEKCAAKYNTSSADISKSEKEIEGIRSVKENTPSLSNRNMSPLSSHSTTRNGSINSRNDAESRSNSSRRSRSSSPRRSRSSSPSRSRSNSSRRSRSNSSRRSRSNSPRRSGSNSTRRSRSKSPRRSRSNTSLRSHLNSSRRSRSNLRSRSRSVSFAVRRTSSPIAPMQFGTGESASSNFHYMKLMVNELSILTRQNYERIAVNDRRLARMEVSINKVLVTVTDLKNAMNSKNNSVGRTSTVVKPKEVPRGFKVPSFPMQTMPQLVMLSKQLRDGEFRLYMLTEEKYYCTASRQSDTVVLTGYLKRFISLDLRDKLHLKDAKGTGDPTLFSHFPEIYNFLIDVMVQGYADSNNQLKPSDAHIALRTVWGRTKQTIKERKEAK